MKVRRIAPIPLFGGGSRPLIPPSKIFGSKRGQRFAKRTKVGRYGKYLCKRQVYVGASTFRGAGNNNRRRTKPPFVEQRRDRGPGAEGDRGGRSGIEVRGRFSIRVSPLSHAQWSMPL